MRKFKFTLQSVLNLKSALEKQAINELGIVQRRLESAKQELWILEQTQASYLVQYGEKAASGTSVIELMNYSIYLERLKNTIVKQNDKIETINTEILRVRKKVLELMGERKVLEKLKEKQFADYMVEWNRDNDKITEDFMGYKVGADLERGI